jgi:transporter family protein
METGWLVFALLSAFTAALVAILAKVGLQGVDPTTATAIRGVIMALFLVGVVLAQGKLDHVDSIMKNQTALFFIVLSGIIGALSWLFYFLALQKGQVNQVAPVDRLSMVFAIVMAALFLNEKITLNIGLGVVLMTVGAILVAIG